MVARRLSATRGKNVEHRWGERVTAAIEVRLTAGSFCLSRGVLRDVSVSGGYVETRLRVPL
jgi:hypothetical protein